MPDPTSQVVGADSQSVPEQGTTPAAGVTPNVTPSQQPPVDVETIRAEYEQKLAASQRDISQLKSSLQRQAAQQNKEWQTRYEQLQQQFREVRLGTMDETQRKQYEQQMQTEEVTTLRQQLAEAQQRQQEIAAVADATQFFMDKGVDPKRLIRDQGYEALVQSGWDAVSEELESLRQLKNGQAPRQPNNLPQAPNVVTDKSTPVTGPSWRELVTKYGSEERVFQLADQGLVDLTNVIMPRIS